jgi:exopolysaccharide biosynthesis operon protein EpsL
MNSNIKCFLKNLLILPVVILPVSAAFAVVDKFDPYIDAGVKYDSNLFRASSNVESDTIWKLGAGFKSDFKLSRQHLILDLDVHRALYTNNDQLDYTGIDGLGAWEWQAGNLWSGNLGYKYERTPRSYTQNLIPGSITRDLDLRTRQTVFLDAGYQLHPDWKINGAVDFQDVSYQTRTQLDRKSNSGVLEVQYRNTLNTRVGLRGKYTAFDLNDSEIGGESINNDYDVTSLSGVFYWEGSAKSALELLIGYTDVNYDQGDFRNFNGVSGRLTYNWILTGKTKLDISAWREPSNLNDEILDYVLSQGISIEPTWEATTKITVVGELSYENDDFKARNDIRIALGEEAREDDTWLIGIRGKWNPRRYLNVSVGYKYRDRDSTIDIREFTFHQVDAKIKFTF